MLERKLLKNLDVGLVAVVLGIVGLGLMVVFSATHNGIPGAGTDPLYFFKRQLVAAVLGIALMAATIITDYRVFGKAARLVFGVCLVLLVGVLFLGREVAGTKGWLYLGPLSLQPSEMAKIGVIIYLAKHLEGRDDLDTVAGLVSVLVRVALPMALVLLQPDFGTAMVFSGIVLGMLYVAGVPLKYLAGLFGGGFGAIATAVLVSHFGWIKILKPYQVDRILVFLNPYADAAGAGWNVIQSMIAIGSGGLFGKGLFSGSQTQLNFLPARHTDFIFSVVGEEFGFIGAFSLLAAYFIVIYKGLRTVAEAKDRFGALVATGIVSLLMFHLLVNVGMTLGIMPVTGIPLPMVSYGGSALMANLIGMGLLINIQMRRQKILF